METEQQAAWPEGVLARYLTVGGATVDLTHIDRGPRGEGIYVTVATCTGCPYEQRFHWEPGIEKADATAREWAQGHAGTCRAMPKPGGGS